MKVTQEKLPASQIGLEIEITPEKSKDAYEKTLKEFTRSANIPGFRKGKVPRQVLIQRFGSERIKATVLEKLLETSIQEAITQEEIKTLGNIQLRTPFDELLSQFEPGTVLTISAAVDVPPEVTLKQYTGLVAKAEEIKYDPNQVDEVLEDYRKRSATLVPVENRPAQMGDVAIVDFVGRLVTKTADSEADADAEGLQTTEIPGGSADDFQIELEEGQFIEGFIDGIVGMTPGETREISATFPETYPQEDLAGKSTVFTVTLKDLKEKELPELDDDFAEEISEFETLAELRESLATRYQQEAEQQTKANKETAFTAELIKQLEVELPETLIRKEVDFLVTQTVMQLENQGLEIRKMLNQEMVQSLRQRSRPEAITRIKRTLALGEVAKRESIQVDTDAVEAKVNELMKTLSPRDVDRDRLVQVVEEDLLTEKVLAWIEEHGTIELVPEGTLNPAAPDSETGEDVVEGADPKAEDSEDIGDVNAIVEDAEDTLTDGSDDDPSAPSATAPESADAPNSDQPDPESKDATTAELKSSDDLESVSEEEAAIETKSDETRSEKSSKPTKKTAKTKKNEEMS